MTEFPSGSFPPPMLPPVVMPTSIDEKNRSPGKPSCRLQLSSIGAFSNATFDTNPIGTAFVNAFARKIRKYFDVQCGPPVPGELSVIVQITEIDQGNRALRYLVGMFAGGTRLLTNVTIAPVGKDPVSFPLKYGLSLGLLGGNSASMLKTCAKVIAKKTAKRAIKLSR